MHTIVISFSSPLSGAILPKSSAPVAYCGVKVMNAVVRTYPNRHRKHLVLWWGESYLPMCADDFSFTCLLALYLIFFARFAFCFTASAMGLLSLRSFFSQCYLYCCRCDNIVTMYCWDMVFPLKRLWVFTVRLYMVVLYLLFNMKLLFFHSFAAVCVKICSPRRKERRKRFWLRKSLLGILLFLWGSFYFFRSPPINITNLVLRYPLFCYDPSTVFFIEINYRFTYAWNEA